MNIGGLARGRSKLTRLVGFLYQEERPALAAISFAFEGNEELFLFVDPNTDSLSWRKNAPIGFKAVALEIIIPRVRTTYGLYLAWAWEMVNQQGYFDAVQLEMNDASLANEMVFQFKASASKIIFFELLRMP